MILPRVEATIVLITTSPYQLHSTKCLQVGTFFISFIGQLETTVITLAAEITPRMTHADFLRMLDLFPK